MLGYWPHATHKKNKFWYICIFAAVALKTGYSKYEIGIYFFYNIKKIQTYKINIPENKSLSLSLFFQKKRVRKSGWVTCPSKWPGWTQKGGVKFKKSWRALFKWINSLEQCKHKTENMHAARWREKNRPGNGSEEAAATLKAWCLIRCSSVSNVFLLLCIYICFSASKHLELQVSLVFSSIYCVFFLLCLSCVFSYLSLYCFFFAPFSPVFSSFLCSFFLRFSPPLLGH